MELHVQPTGHMYVIPVWLVLQQHGKDVVVFRHCFTTRTLLHNCDNPTNVGKMARVP
ncbi:MAG: hypothetical protein IJX89_05245 [Alphaproteobacteria bacterium]|nr:hypothetical protein [Alphaproteobacteria bacterium]